MSAARSARLGFGQRYMWLRHHQYPQAHRHDPNLVMTCEMDTAISMARLRALLNHVVRRHEALRTTYHHDTGGDPEQRVHPPAPLRLLVATTERDGTPAPADVVGRLGSTPFDLAGEWPIRACAITTGGVPRRLVLAFNHMSIDRWTVMRIDRDLAVLYAAVRAGRPARLEPIRHQPLDLARYESTVPTAASLAWWRERLAALPADPLAARRDPHAAGQATEAALTSPALLAASRRIAARRGVWPSLVYLTAYNAVMAAYSGSPALGQLCFTSNRESSDHAGVHTCMFSPQLMTVDCGGDPTFGELVDRVAASFAEAGRHSYVPYDEVVALAALESGRRGQTVRLGAEVNLISEPDKRSRARHTTFVRRPAPAAWASYGADTYVRVHEWQDATGVTFDARASVLDTAAVETFLRGFEHVVLDHDSSTVERPLSGIAAALGFPPPPRQTIAVRGDLVDPAHVTEVLLTHPGVHAVTVSTVDDALVAEVRADDGITERALTGHVAGHLDGPGALRCPDTVRVESTGTPSRAPSDHPAVAVLTAIVSQVNDLAPADPEHSYAAAGGRVLRVPAVLAHLGAQGWHGLDVNQLCSAVPLRALATRLVPTEPPPRRPCPAPAEADLAHL